MDAECKAIEKKMQSEVDQFKSIQKGEHQIDRNIENSMIFEARFSMVKWNILIGLTIG